jgi:flagellar FliL protein
MTYITQVNGKPGQKSSPRVLWMVLGLALITSSSWIGCKHSSPEPDATKKTGTDVPQINGVMHLEGFVVNLADTDVNCFLRVGIDLGLEKPLPSKGEKGEEGGASTSRVRDTILGVLSTWRSDALLAPDGRQKLKADLLHAFHEREPELGVKEIYFTDFLVQR